MLALCDSFTKGVPSVQSVYLHHCWWVKHPHFTDAEEKEGEKNTDSYGITTTLIMLDGKYRRVFRAIMSDKYRRADTETSSKHKKEGGNLTNQQELLS